MTAPSVSVVMPVRDAASTLPAAISSLQGQTHREIEIVIVDHRSTDRSSEIVRQAARSDSRIRVFAHAGTFVEAANLAWQESNGDLIARMDSDDVAHPDRIAEQVRFMTHHPEIAACGTQVKILKRGPDNSPLPPDQGYRHYESWVNSITTPEDIFAQRFIDSPIPNPTAMIRRPVMESLGGYQDPEWAEDYDFWLRLLEAGHRIGKVELPLLEWFDSDTRATRSKPRYALPRFQAAKAFYLSRLPIVQKLGVTICGAGPIGKEMASLLRARGIHVHAFIEVNEKQIGNEISGVPVLNLDALNQLAGDTVIMAAVGQKGARERIRGLLQAYPLQEGKDFFCVA